MTPRLDLNADLGEHDGPPPSAARTLLRLVTSANIACGAHAGDDRSMRAVSAEAAALGIQIGAHPAFPDRVGFGRRVVAMRPDEVTDTVARQIDALSANAMAEDATVRHVKPHGALYTLAFRDRPTADAIAAGILLANRALALYAPSGSALAVAGAAAGLRVIAEGFLDRAYEKDGSLTPRDMPGAVLHDPDLARSRALEWAGTGMVRTGTGIDITLPIESLCVHGDTPEALAIATQVRAALTDAGVRLMASLAP